MIIERTILSVHQQQWLSERAVHLIASPQPLGVVESGETTLLKHVSAGHKKHDYVTGSAMPLIM